MLTLSTTGSIIFGLDINQFYKNLFSILCGLLIVSFIFHYRYLFVYNSEEKSIFYNTNYKNFEVNNKAKSYSPSKSKKISIDLTKSDKRIFK